MNVLQTIAELSALPGPICLAIGVFDGVHLGHRAVIESAVASAKEHGGTAAVVTFDPHPATILRPDQAPALLTSTRHKLKLLAELGVTHTLVQSFDHDFASTPPANFIMHLAEACRPLRQICVGENWAFGNGRSGNLDLLKLLGQTLRFDAVGVPSVLVDGEPISSTAVRAAIQSGDLTGAARLLGRNFSVLGKVQPGRQLARTLGFPTANVPPECHQLPPNGVYLVEVNFDGQRKPGIANIGLRPTVETNATQHLLEVHLFDFSGDLVGQDLDVFFREFLRPEQKFPSIDALRAAIEADVARAKSRIAEGP